LDILRDRVSELEQSLVESDHLKQKYLQEKNRSVWEWQKTQKVGKKKKKKLENNPTCKYIF
jgi:hypothetical protein